MEIFTALRVITKIKEIRCRGGTNSDCISSIVVCSKHNLERVRAAIRQSSSEDSLSTSTLKQPSSLNFTEESSTFLVTGGAREVWEKIIKITGSSSSCNVKSSSSSSEFNSSCINLAISGCSVSAFSTGNEITGVLFNSLAFARVSFGTDGMSVIMSARCSVSLCCSRANSSSAFKVTRAKTCSFLINFYGTKIDVDIYLEACLINLKILTCNNLIISSLFESEDILLCISETSDKCEFALGYMEPLKSKLYISGVVPMIIVKVTDTLRQHLHSDRLRRASLEEQLRNALQDMTRQDESERNELTISSYSGLKRKQPPSGSSNAGLSDCEKSEISPKISEEIAKPNLVQEASNLSTKSE
ncbi:hypothetical protein GQX74_010765 [Glossina fuscipes]|nr:hypothetical protein GQX74_010765 [Glossina fuscipes]